MKGKISSGIDNIPNLVFKNVPKKLLEEFRKVFNCTLGNSYFPKKWKVGKIVTLTKKDMDSSDSENLRAITRLLARSSKFA